MLLLALLPLSASAAVQIIQPDADLINEADAIVIGTIRGMTGVYALNGDIVTEIDIVPERVLKGDIPLGETLRIRENGGLVGSRAMFVSEAPVYWDENRALIFLERTADGSWRTYGASMGKFDFVQDNAQRNLAVRWATEEHGGLRWTPEGTPHEERLRDSDLFLRYIVRVVGHVSNIPRRRDAQPPAADYFVEQPAAPDQLSKPAAFDPVVTATYPPSAYTQGTFRWDVFDKGGSTTFFASGTQPGYDHIGAAQRALAAWTNEPGSNIDYRYGGTNSRGFVEDSVNTIVFNSSADVPAGALAYSKWYANNVHTYKGEQFYSISEGDAVMKSSPGVSQKVFDEAITHELGHTLGFRHSDQGTPSSTQAVMKAVLSGAYGATLGPWDIEAAQTVYTATNTTPTSVGTPTNVVATATGTSTASVTWTGAANAQAYDVERAEVLGQWAVIARVNGTSFNDSGLTANKTYLYRVRAVNGSTMSTYSNIDHATTIVFADDPLVPRSTVIKAVHLTQLRTAVNAVRVAAALPVQSWTDPNPAGVPVKAVHITQLRSALSAALTALGKSASFTDPSLGTGVVVKAVHFQELRNLTK